MAKSERYSSTLVHHQQQQQHDVDDEDHIHMVEEYVLDEHDLNSLQVFDVVTPSATSRTSVPINMHSQHRHVRRSAELRTVSIIETLSELVSRTDNGHLLTDADQHVVSGGVSVNVDSSDCDGHQCHHNRQGHVCSNRRTIRNDGSASTSMNINAGLKGCSRVPAPMLELSPIQYWKSPTETAQRQRPVLVKQATNGAACLNNYNGIKKKTSKTLPILTSSTNINGIMHRDNCSRPIRDPNHFMMSTLRSKGRTPDWIAGIFSIARRGNLERLRHALLDMDATLIRNLSDHRGNNLFHVCCCYGHLECLQWLLRRGKQCEDAILDENKYELTPLVCAVKYGKTPCVEWLISNTIARSQLVPPTGSRPLLHWAAKYGQEVILRWLAEYMESNMMDVNVKDGYGNTSLHLAAKHGHATSIKALVTHRCDVSLKNDLGYKASDYAILYGQVACSEYLLSLEACLLMSANVASLDYDLNSAKAELSELKTQFKEVLSCAKKLIKEREELHQNLSRSEDSLAQLNKSIVNEIRALVEENALLREKLNGSNKTNINESERVDETIASLCHAMHARWQESQQRLPPVVALFDVQQKILLAEEKWKRARARVTWNEGRESREHMDVFRDKLTQVQCRATGIRLSDIRSISSSESSLASMEDTMSEYEDRYGQVSTTSPLPNYSLDSVNVNGVCNCHDVMDDLRCAAQKLQPPPPSMVTSNRRTSTNLVDAVAPITTNNKSEISKTRKLETLNSEQQSSTCKVLQVIVSATSGDNDEDLKPVQQQRRRKTKPSNGAVDCKGEVLNCHCYSDDDKDEDRGLEGVKSNGTTSLKCNYNTVNEDKEDSRWSPPKGQEKNPTTSSAFRTSMPPFSYKTGLLISSEPDLIVHTKSIRSALSLASSIPVQVQERDDSILQELSKVGVDSANVNTNGITDDTDDASGIQELESVQNGSLDTSRDSANANDESPLIQCEASTSGFYPTSSSTTKRRGFLQKLNLRWPSKRKVKSTKKVQEISAEDFRETYLHLRNGNGDETIYELNDQSDQSSFEIAVPMTGTSDTVEEKTVPHIKKRSKSYAVIIGETGSELQSVSGMSSKTVSQLELNVENSPSSKQLDGLNLRPALSCPGELPMLTKAISSPSTITLKTSNYTSGSTLDIDKVTKDEDDDDDDDDNKEESPPEAEQGVSFERPLSMAPEGEEDSSSIHAQAHLPPKRPTSHCIKSDHNYFGRPESSASRTESYSAFRLPVGFPLRKVSSVSTDLLTPVDSMTPSRMSPAPSEVSKTESALLSPNVGDSLRQLGPIEERPIASTKIQDIQSTHIVEINASESTIIKVDKETKKSGQLVDALTVIDQKDMEENGNGLEKTIILKDVVPLTLPKHKNIQKENKAWYELSDDEEILMPETLTTKNGQVIKSSSEEDEAYFCT